MKGSKRILSLLLVVMLVISIFPAGIASAADQGTQTFSYTTTEGTTVSLGTINSALNESNMKWENAALDGVTLDASNRTLTFNKAGTFKVELKRTVNRNYFNTDTYHYVINVTVNPVAAGTTKNFSITAKEGDTVKFSDITGFPTSGLTLEGTKPSKVDITYTGDNAGIKFNQGGESTYTFTFKKIEDGKANKYVLTANIYRKNIAADLSVSINKVGTVKFGEALADKIKFDDPEEKLASVEIGSIAADYGISIRLAGAAIGAATFYSIDSVKLLEAAATSEAMDGSKLTVTATGDKGAVTTITVTFKVNSANAGVISFNANAGKDTPIPATLVEQNVKTLLGSDAQIEKFAINTETVYGAFVYGESLLSGTPVEWASAKNAVFRAGTVVPASPLNISYTATTDKGEVNGKFEITIIGSTPVAKTVIINTVSKYDVDPVTKKAVGVVGDIAADIYYEINKTAGRVDITSISFDFNEKNVSIVAGNYADIVSGVEYKLNNYSQITFTTANPTSDVDIRYTAVAGEVSYIGYVSLNKIAQKTIAPLEYFAIYTGTKSYNAVIKTSDLKLADTISSFTVQSVTFTTGSSTVSNTSGSASYGYFTNVENGKTAVSSFGSSATLYYNPGTTSGTATVTYKGYSKNTEYTGTFVITVFNGANQNVTLTLKNRDPYSLITESKEKTTFAKSLAESAIATFNDKTVTLSYVVFDTPIANSARFGTLYSNDDYAALSTATGYYFSQAVADKATLPANELYYVPTDTAGTYAINYTVGVIYNKTVYELKGTLEIVTKSDELLSYNIVYSTTAGKSVYFDATDFQAFVTGKGSKYVLKSISLNDVPDVGTLSYGTTRFATANLAESFAVSGTGRLINNICYTPNGYNYYETIPFTATYALTGTSELTSTVSGTILIVITKNAVADINYSVPSMGTLNLNGSDFYNVCYNATGSTIDHVYFDVSSISGGVLYYNSVSSSNKVKDIQPIYYSSSKTPYISKVIFDPSVTSNKVTIPYDVYTSGGTYLYTGYVYVTVYTTTPTPQFKSCVKSAQKVIFNGKAITLEAYLIDDYNYVKLRDVAYIMNGTGSQFAVNFDTKNVYCTKGSAYVPSAGDMQTGKDLSKTCVVSSFNIYVDNVYQSAYVYNIGGNNYFKLRDLGSILGFVVDWDEKSGTVIINSSDYRG